MRTERINPKIFTSIAGALFVVLFAYAATDKLMHIREFRNHLGVTFLSPMRGVIVWMAPAAELLTCLFLMVPAWRKMGLWSAFTLMIVFTAYIIVMLTAFDRIPCSCGGVINTLSWHEHLIFNTALILLAGGALLLHVKFDRKKKL